MKRIITVIGLIVSSNLYALEKKQCILEQYFLQTESYKSSLIDSKEKKLELDRKELSLSEAIRLWLSRRNRARRSISWWHSRRNSTPRADCQKSAGQAENMSWRRRRRGQRSAKAGRKRRL